MHWMRVKKKNGTLGFRTFGHKDRTRPNSYEEHWDRSKESCRLPKKVTTSYSDILKKEERYRLPFNNADIACNVSYRRSHD